MTFVLRRLPDGAYVTPPGMPASYTRALQDARVFATREEAERQRCPGNEIVVDVEFARLMRVAL